MNDVEIYEPFENSDLIDIIPSEDKVFYSAKFKVSCKGKKVQSNTSLSHVILTDNGMAFKYSRDFPIQLFCCIRYGTNLYIPWHAFQYLPNKKGLRIGKKFGVKYLYLYKFNIIQNNDLEVIKPYEQLNIELDERSKILIEHSKNKIYKQLEPILKSYPKGKMPYYNPSSIIMTGTLYKNLSFRVYKEINKEVREGNYKYRKKIKLPKKLTYSKERINEEVKKFNLVQGMYDEVKKIEEMVIVFINFFIKHTFDEVIELLLELYEIDPLFVIRWFNKAKVEILKKYPKKDQDIFELEYRIIDFHMNLMQKFLNLGEITDESVLFKKDELIIAHFNGSLNSKKAHFELPGHIYITNYRMLAPNVPKSKNVWIPATGAVTGMVAGFVTSRIEKHIVKARIKFIKVLIQNPDMFFFNNPYNIFNPSPGILRFTMNYDYSEKNSSQTKVYNFIVSLIIKKYKGEQLEEFKKRRSEIYSIIREHFSKIPKTVCPSCNIVQDKSLDKCENCGKVLELKV